MGFDQQKITHHFLLRKDGGAIQVTANSAEDKTSKEEIQMHLHHITQAFKSGDFNIPMFVHDQTPPGVDVMTKLKDQIHYKYETAANGGRVVGKEVPFYRQEISSVAKTLIIKAEELFGWICDGKCGDTAYPAQSRQV